MAYKKILITIGHGLVSRNLMRSGFVQHLLANNKTQLVVLTQAASSPDFKSEFDDPRISILPMPTNNARVRRENILNSLHALTIFNKTTEVKFSLRSDKSVSKKLSYLLRKVTSRLIGQSKLVRLFLSRLDQILLPDSAFGKVLDKEQPDIVFATSIFMRIECDLVKAARARDIPIIAMAKSWDNLVKDVPLRMAPDRLLVWNKVMQKEASVEQLISNERIRITGIPQFDVYESREVKEASRVEFMKKIGADPDKKLILFAAEGKWSPGDPDTVKIIKQAIVSKKISEDCHLHCRPHFCFTDFIKPLQGLAEDGLVSVDDRWNRFSSFPDNWDPDHEDIMHLALTLRFADLVVTPPSTIVLDAAYFDKPIINVAFDKLKNPSSPFRVHKLYQTEYFHKVIEYNATAIAKCADELIAQINIQLENPKMKSTERNKLIEDYCFRRDGMAAKRLSEEILNFCEEYS